MLHIDNIRRALQYMVLSKVSDATKIDRNTLTRIRNGVAPNPSHRTIETLSQFLRGILTDD